MYTGTGKNPVFKNSTTTYVFKLIFHDFKKGPYTIIIPLIGSGTGPSNQPHWYFCSKMKIHFCENSKGLTRPQHKCRSGFVIK